MRSKLAIILLILAIIISSCSVKRMAADKDMSYLYFPPAFKLHPEYTLRHFSDSIINIHYRFSPKELFAIEDTSNLDTLPVLHLRFELYNYNFELFDSSTVKYFLKDLSTSQALQSVQKINTAHYDNCYLYISSFNTLNNYLNEQVFMLDSSIHTYNFSKLSQNNRGLNSYTNVYHSTQNINLSELNADSVYVNYYKPQEYLYQSPTYDSIPNQFLIPDTSYWSKNTSSFTMESNGKYILKPDSISTDSLCFLNFGSNYLKMQYIDDIIGPLQYIATEKEYRAIVNADNPKLAYDNFWLNITNDIEHARELIRMYNSRAFYANIYFNADQEGWKTDRGMVFIVYGFPDYLKISENTEIWYYGDARKKGFTKFVFQKMHNACTLNDFALQRNNNVNSLWAKAIQTWREGNIYKVRNYRNDE